MRRKIAARAVVRPVPAPWYDAGASCGGVRPQEQIAQWPIALTITLAIALTAGTPIIRGSSFYQDSQFPYFFMEDHKR